MRALLAAAWIAAVPAASQTSPRPSFDGPGSPLPGMPVTRPAERAPGAPEQPPAPKRPRCPRPTVWVERGELYKDGVFIGSRPARHDTTCTGVVYWTDEAHGIFRDWILIGADARSFAVEDLSGSVAWLDLARGVWKDGVYMGGPARSYALRRGSGELVWLDDAGGLFRGSALLASDAVSFELSDPDARLVWTDRHGLKHVEPR